MPNALQAPVSVSLSICCANKKEGKMEMPSLLMEAYHFMCMVCYVCMSFVDGLYTWSDDHLWRGRLFQEERPVWHTINCNVLPKDYKDTKVEEESKEQIVMVTDNEAPSKYDSEEWQTLIHRALSIRMKWVKRMIVVLLCFLTYWCNR